MLIRIFMNTSELITFIKEPSQMGKQQLAALKKVESDFPYFQGIQVLLAKSLANQKHYEFSKQLHKTGLSVPDREVLYRFIHDLPSELIESPTIVPYTEPTVVELVQPKNETIIIDSAEQVIEVEVPIVTDLAVELSNVEKVSLEIVLDETISEEKIEKEQEQVKEKEIEKESSINSHESEYHSFTEWLKMSKGEVVVDVTKDKQENVKPPISTEVIEEKVEIKVEVSTPIVSKTEEIEDTNIVVFESILDRFIKDSPRISRPKAEFYKPANMAKQSVEEDEDLVTETLAKLYYQQGHYKKAIRAYEKLCLIYPHKMAYFADLILKIKQESKD